MAAILSETRSGNASLPVVAGVLLLISFVMPWWSASTSTSSLSVSPLSLGQLLNQPKIGLITVGANPLAAILAPVALAMGCILGLAGAKHRAASVLSVLAVVSSIVIFVLGLKIGLGVVMSFPGTLGLWGSLSLENDSSGTYTSWGFSLGLYLTVIAALALVASILPSFTKKK